MNINELVEIVAKKIINEINQGFSFTLVDLQTRRSENTLEFIFDRKKQLDFPYDNWGNDLDDLPERTMSAWSEYFCNKLLKAFNHEYFSKNFVYFYWLDAPIISNYSLIIPPYASQTGDVLHEVFVKTYDGVGVVLLTEKAIVYINKKAEVTLFMHDKIQAAKINYAGNLLFNYENKTYEFKTLVYDAERDYQRGFKKAYIEDKLVNNIDNLFKNKAWQKIIDNRAQIEIKENNNELYYLMMSYYKIIDYRQAIEVGKKALLKEPANIDFLDALAPAFLKSGDFNGLIQVFNDAGDNLLNKKSMEINNFIANMVIPFIEIKDYDGAKKLAQDYYNIDTEYADRIYHHNFACLYAQLKAYDQAIKCLAKAIEYGEDQTKIEGESDFAPLLDNPEYKKQIFSLLEKEQKVKTVKYGEDDIRMFIKEHKQSHDVTNLIQIARIGGENAFAYFKEILDNKYSSEQDIEYTFFSLIALGDEKSISLARDFYKKNKKIDFMMFLFIDEFSSWVQDKEKFKQDILSVMDDRKGNFLVENMK